MSLVSGTKLGPYQILAPLGAGGMGEVYRALDTRLNRTVAIKILPAQFSFDLVRKQRFESEAKTIASLNHPHICVLHDVGHQDGIDYLVMECVEGETLAKHLEKGPLLLDQVLRLGAQIADALDKAHRAGIVHRDLKPGNIMLTVAGAKLLDFGLAKPAAPLVSGPTLTAAVPTRPVTQEGTIVGTFQYMSPEQVEGKELDGRSDIFSLGAVLYETMTGKKAFEGQSQLSVVSAILEKEPAPISAVKPMTPPALDHAIRRCLAKDTEGRWQTARDLALELKWVSETETQFAAKGPGLSAPRAWQQTGWRVSALLLLALSVVSITWWIRARQHPSAMHFNSAIAFPANDVALSPDGRILAVVGYPSQGNKYMVWTHEIGGVETTVVPGTEGAAHPFWSADGHFIAFFADGKLKKTDASGKLLQILCDAPNGRGGTWNRDGVILFTPDVFGGIFRVSASGGTPVEVTKLDSSRSESSHRWPVFLPDQRHFLYLAANLSGQYEKNAIFAGALDSDEKRFILNASFNVAYAAPGYLLYLNDTNSLVARRFDLASYSLSGDPVTVRVDVQRNNQTDRALFDVRGGGVLVAQSPHNSEQGQLTWLDRVGKQMGLIGSAGRIRNPALSLDGKRLAFDLAEPGEHMVNIWTRDLVMGVVSRLSLEPTQTRAPVWSPDGKRIAFSSNRGDFSRPYAKNADGSGTEEQISDLGGRLVYVWDWSRDGKYLLMRKDNEVWSISLPSGKARPYLQAKWTVRLPHFSPDGKWVAYSTNESGIWEVYVSPFPEAGSKWLVSRGGGDQPKWRADGRELFYLSSGGKMMSVTVKAGGSFEAGEPTALFQTQPAEQSTSRDLFSYDVTADGQRFLVNERVGEAKAAPLAVILNWASEIEK